MVLARIAYCFPTAARNTTFPSREREISRNDPVASISKTASAGLVFVV